MCEYCEKVESIIEGNILEGDGKFSIYVGENHLEMHTVVDFIGKYYTTKINYCPMCGRKLQEKAE